MDNTNNDPPSSGPTDISPDGTTLIDKLGMDKDMDKTTSNKAESFVTLQPYESPSGPSGTPKRKTDSQVKGKRDKNFRKKGTDYEMLPGFFIPTNYDKYLSIDINNPEADIFDVHRDIVKCCGRTPKVSQLKYGRLLVETNSPEESVRLQNLSSLGGNDAVCTPHPTLNQSKGLIYAPQLMKYSEERLHAEFEAQGVSKVERMKKMIDGALTPQPNLILTFDNTVLPKVIYAAWYKIEVKPFIPRPRRCFYCQEFGHVVTSCRLKDQGKPSICKNCGEEEHGMCAKISKCVHCGSNHPASSFECDVYIFEKEVQATRTKERISFAEAKEKVLTKFIRPGVSFARVATDRRFLKKNRIIHSRTTPRMKRTLSKESLSGNNAKKKVVPDNAPIDTTASLVAASASSEAAPAVAGASSSLKAAPAAAGASASLEAASAVAGASASSEAVPALAGASASSEAVPAVAGRLASSEVVRAVVDVTSMEVTSVAACSSSSKKGKGTSAQAEEEEENSMSELYASCNSLPDLASDIPVSQQKTDTQDQSPKKQRRKTAPLQNKGKNKIQSNPIVSTVKLPKSKVLQRNSGIQSSKSK